MISAIDAYNIAQGTYSEELKYMDEYKNNFPDFESELFYHYLLGNVLSSFMLRKGEGSFQWSIITKQ